MLLHDVDCCSSALDKKAIIFDNLDCLIRTKVLTSLEGFPGKQKLKERKLLFNFVFCKQYVNFTNASYIN